MVHLMGLGSAFILSCKAFKDLKRYMLCTSCAHNIKCVILCTISKWIYIPLGESVQLCIAAAQHVFFQNPFKGALRKPLLGFFLAGNLCWFMLFQMHKHRCMGCVTVTNTSFFFSKAGSQTITVDHNPGGGHWFVAGLSPQVIFTTLYRHYF